MKDGNNGGYANAWLIADISKNEIGRLELGLRTSPWNAKTTGTLSARISRLARILSAKRPTSTPVT